MKSRLLLTIALFSVVLAIAACSTPSRGVADWSYRAAQDEADRDIKSGRIKIYWGGTGEAHPLVPPESRQLAESYPRKDLPSGGTDPVVHRAMGYGQAYNWEVLSYLAQNPGAAAAKPKPAARAPMAAVTPAPTAAKRQPARKAPPEREIIVQATPEHRVKKSVEVQKPAPTPGRVRPSPSAAPAKPTPKPKSTPKPKPTPKQGYDPYQTQYL